MGSVGVLPDFKFYIAVFGVPSGSIGLVAPLRLKMLDSQPDSSNMGPVSIDFHDFGNFQKSCHVFWARYLSCFQPGRPKSRFSGFPVETKKKARRKVMQIRSGITSRSAVFDLFVHI